MPNQQFHDDVAAILATPALLAAIMPPGSTEPPDPERLLAAWTALRESYRDILRHLYGLDGRPPWTMGEYVVHRGWRHNTGISSRSVAIHQLRDRLAPMGAFYRLPKGVQNLLEKANIHTPEELYQQARNLTWEGWGPQSRKALEAWLHEHRLPIPDGFRRYRK